MPKIVLYGKNFLIPFTIHIYVYTYTLKLIIMKSQTNQLNSTASNTLIIILGRTGCFPTKNLLVFLNNSDGICKSALYMMFFNFFGRNSFFNQKNSRLILQECEQNFWPADFTYCTFAFQTYSRNSQKQKKLFLKSYENFLRYVCYHFFCAYFEE